MAEVVERCAPPLAWPLLLPTRHHAAWLRSRAFKYAILNLLSEGGILFEASLLAELLSFAPVRSHGRWSAPARHHGGHLPFWIYCLRGKASAELSFWLRSRAFENAVLNLLPEG